MVLYILLSVIGTLLVIILSLILAKINDLKCYIKNVDENVRKANETQWGSINKNMGDLRELTGIFKTWCELHGKG